MQYDIIVIGAGPAGLSFACSLSNSSLNVLLIDIADKETLASPAIDGRDIALTHLSVKLLKQIGAWQRLADDAISPMKAAHVLDGDSSYALKFTHDAAGVDALGYLVPNSEIKRILYDQATTAENITFRYETQVKSIRTNDYNGTVELSNGEELNAKLIVSADSRFSQTRRQMGISSSVYDFGRSAIVCRMKHDKPHEQTALECFKYGCTLATLPINHQQSSIVLTISSEKLSQFMSMDEATYASSIQKILAQRLGHMELVGERYVYPLVAVHANKFYAQRYALIGDAAVGMHPVTAHGFNLGLQSSALLAKEISSTLYNSKDIANLNVLKVYESQHMKVTKPLYIGTNTIIHLFTNDSIFAKLHRKLALRVSNHLMPVKKLILNKLTEKNLNTNLWRFSPRPQFSQKSSRGNTIIDDY